MNNPLEYVVETLRAMPRAEWRAVASSANVGESTVEKIAYGVTKDPGAMTIHRLAIELGKRTTS